MRIVSDNFPENLKKTENKTPHVKVKLEPGSLELRITDAKLSDTGLYICMRKKYGDLLTFNVTYLKVEESAVTEVPPSSPVCPRNLLTLQCLVLQNSLRNPCPFNETTLCFSADFNQSDPNKTENNSTNEEENTSKRTAGTKCVSFFPKNVGFFDGWTYYRAIPKCKENTSQVNTGANIWTSKMQEVVIKLLIAVLFISHIFIVFLIYLVQKLKKRIKGLSNEASTGGD